ncbi:hypothetical protein [Paenibacillus methanolicus]|uniref:Uncharacterized protein n=1 Tax=Paenibacillus methanolicus TaxID=582686 RepID=A0A5S5C1A7_9BACL|nr:hypothetical protein [Paenibacillus methanolicus]TYP73215.1 hypothetical protein BCM02_107199 [Paenibacillus methanolicus]
MSEFTAGSLTIQPYKTKLSEMNPVYMRDLNDKWVLFMTEDTEAGEELPEQVRALSAALPVLYFYNFEDHAWGYRIVHEGEELAALHVSYEVKDEFIMQLAAQRYPDQDLFELVYVDPGQTVYNQLAQEVNAWPSYVEAVANQFANRNVEQFRLFDVEDACIERLRDILNGDYYGTLGSYRQLVREFKEVLHMKEMSWIRYDSLA